MTGYITQACMGHYHSGSVCLKPGTAVKGPPEHLHAAPDELIRVQTSSDYLNLEVHVEAGAVAWNV